MMATATTTFLCCPTRIPTSAFEKRDVGATSRIPKRSSTTAARSGVRRQQDEHQDVGASINMNIIYLECKLLDIPKREFDFIGMLGCRRRRAAVPLPPPLFYSNDCGGQFYSNEKQFPFLLLICNQML
jgi:hypothetical protein